jgi:hypothetical protein
MPAHLNKYLEVSLSNEEVADRVKYCIKTNTPFCLSRIGDAEIHIINNNVPDALKNKIAKLWNFDILQFDSMREIFYDHLVTCLKYSDIVGIMDFNNKVCQKMKFKKEQWSLSLDALKKMNIDIPICCDHQLPRSRLFGDPNNFKNIISGVPINIITPNSNINVNKICNLLQTDVSVTIVDNDRQTIINKLAHINENVVLYGVSITAKDLGVILKRQNKIAIDFGATLDAWAGIESRPWFKNGNLQDYCVIK